MSDIESLESRLSRVVEKLKSKEEPQQILLDETQTLLAEIKDESRESLQKLQNKLEEARVAASEYTSDIGTKLRDEFSGVVTSVREKLGQLGAAVEPERDGKKGFLAGLFGGGLFDGRFSFDGISTSIA